MNQLRLRSVLPFILFIASIGVQHYNNSNLRFSVRDLPPVVGADQLRLLSLGEPALASRFISFGILGIESQLGRAISYKQLNYQRLSGWLQTMLDLDPLTAEPLAMAAGVFIDVDDQLKMRQMIEFVALQFQRDPQRHWRWLAQVATIAKYRLQDIELALSLAAQLQQSKIPLPAWARDMHVLLLADIGEHAAANALLRHMIDSGSIKDAAELRFLTKRLQQITPQ